MGRGECDLLLVYSELSMACFRLDFFYYEETSICIFFHFVFSVLIMHMSMFMVFQCDFNFQFFSVNDVKCPFLSLVTVNDPAVLG